MTAVDGVRERLEIERASPGAYTRYEFIKDVEFLLAELEEREAELELTKTLVDWQAGFEK